MECSKCGCEGFELFEHNGKQYCQGCIETVTIPALVFSRIVGYLTPTSGWNTGKQQEFADRVVYQVPNSGSDSLNNEIAAWDSASDLALLNFEAEIVGNNLPEQKRPALTFDVEPL